LGALIAAATLLNVVMLNVCFNVGVKLWSANLLVMAVGSLPNQDRPGEADARAPHLKQ
jgi:hypothetical protein